jgi:hypothetical protein
VKIFVLISTAIGSLVAIAARHDITEFGGWVRLGITLGFAAMLIGLVMR